MTIDFENFLALTAALAMSGAAASCTITTKDDDATGGWRSLIGGAPATGGTATGGATATSGAGGATPGVGGQSIAGTASVGGTAGSASVLAGSAGTTVTAGSSATGGGADGGTAGNAGSAASGTAGVGGAGGAGGAGGQVCYGDLATKQPAPTCNDLPYSSLQCVGGLRAAGMEICLSFESKFREGVREALINCLSEMPSDAGTQCVDAAYDTAWACVNRATHGACTAGDSQPIVLCGQIIGACPEVTGEQCLASFYAMKADIRATIADCMDDNTGTGCGDNAWACYDS
jgi:hypothetical protein